MIENSDEQTFTVVKYRIDFNGNNTMQCYNNIMLFLYKYIIMVNIILFI